MLSLGADDAEVGFGYSGECLVGQKQASKLTLYHFAKKSHQLVWNRPIPNGLNYDCRKWISPSGTIVLRNPGYSKQSTLLFDKNLTPLKTFAPTSDYINGLHKDEYITYAQLLQGKLSMIRRSLHNHDLLQELDQPFQGNLQYRDWVHLCVNPTSGLVALVNNCNKWLVIFNSSGLINMFTLKYFNGAVKTLTVQTSMEN